MLIHQRYVPPDTWHDDDRKPFLRFETLGDFG
jgi:hypothetical protein